MLFHWRYLKWYVIVSIRDKWVPVTTTWRLLRLRMEECPPIWRIAANILISSHWQPKSGGPPAWGLGDVLTNLHRKSVSCYETFTQKALGFEWYFGTIQSTKTGQEIWYLECQEAVEGRLTWSSGRGMWGYGLDRAGSG